MLLAETSYAGAGTHESFINDTTSRSARGNPIGSTAKDTGR